MPDLPRDLPERPGGRADTAGPPFAGIPIVGIGASAGGIEALSRFFDAMPADSGAAFVVVLHLDPTHESQLAPVLSQHTNMAVVEIADGMPIEANRVHVIVPDRSVTVRGGRLHLIEPAEPRGQRRPVDVLFVSLADDRRERAIGVVLSGTGNNGMHGLQQIKAQGGMTLAQDPETARFDGMPRSAIAAGAVDHSLAPEAMPATVLHYLRHSYVTARSRSAESASPEERLTLDPVLALLRIRCGHDFRDYKKSTLARRIQRRMGLQNRATVADYAEILRSNPGEMEALLKDLMITVTGFFRDPEAWQALDEAVLGPLIQKQPADAPVRLWVPACATGEEAYSLAMLAVERAEAARKPLDLKVFATDSQPHNLSVARAGLYPEAATAGIAPERRRRFFDRLEGSYQVKPELRERVLFAPQNVLRDPPFSRLDLITCRNLLIYLEPAAQKKVLALFHFALRESGHLFLGTAETVGHQDDLFEAVSTKWRIYRRAGPTRHDILDFPVLGTPARAQHAAKLAEREPAESSARAADLARRALLERFAPASVLIDSKCRVLYFHGSTGDYLEAPAGEPTRDLTAMAREGLRIPLRGAVREALAESRSVSFDARVRHGEALRAISVTVAPLAVPQQTAGLLLVSFQPMAEPPLAAAAVHRGSAVTDSAERALEEELKATRIELQQVVEQMESANEELKASNEEVTSMNEELQSTNEELETSKEELQSYNEELYTINNQLQLKNQQLEESTNDLANLLSGTDIATVFLDAGLKIKWFTPATRELLDLMSSDVGRPIGHFAPKFSDSKLLRDAETVLAKLTRIDAEVRSDSGRWFLRRLIPYRTKDNRIAGLVLTFIDITERKQAADAVNEARIYAETILATLRQPLLILGEDRRVVSANPAFYRLFQTLPKETETRLVYELGNGQWDIPELRRLLSELLPTAGVVTDFQVEHDFQGLGRRIMLLNAQRLERPGRRDELILLAIEDVTARRDAEAHRDLVLGEMSHRVKNSLATVQSIVSQTARQSDSLEHFTTAFESRMQALARVHDLLIAGRWAGTDLRELVRLTLAPYQLSGNDRITTDGPTLILEPQAGIALAMILHELGTNAAKYGALSTPEGRIELTWEVDDSDGRPEARLRWIEAGGPRVEPPARNGFGTRLIARSATHELHGKASLDYGEAGLHCELTFPVPPPPAAPTKG